MSGVTKQEWKERCRKQRSLAWRQQASKPGFPSGLEAAEMKMQSFSLAVTRMDGIRDEDIRSTAHIRCFGDKEANLVTLR